MLLGWLWVVVVGVPQLISSGYLESLQVQPTPQETNEPEAQELSPLAIAFVGAITLLILLVSVIILVKLPKQAIGGSEQIIQKAVLLAVPAVTHHKKLPAAKARALRLRLSYGVQMVLVVVPALICLVLPAYEELSRQIIVYVGLSIAMLATISFTLAWGLAMPATSRTRSRGSRGSR